MQWVLLVEDEETIGIGVKFALEQQGYKVKWVQTLQEASLYINQRIDMILLDLNLPDGIGYTLCERIREYSDVPILFLTVRDEDEDIIKGLDMGADDYITKPFKMGVLLSRVQAVMRRSAQRGIQSEELLHCREISLNKAQTKVYKQGEEVELTKSEYKLLLLLMENKNCTVTRERILDYLWGVDGEFVNNNTLTVTMKRLREKIDTSEHKLIQTIRGIGYRMEE